jgi:hypothetical protein
MTNELTEKSNSTLSDKIFNIQILEDLDFKKLSDSCEFILDNYKDVTMFRPLAVKLFGVLNDKDCPTLETKNYQCKIEAEVHANEIIKELHELEMHKIHIQKAEFLFNTVMKLKYEQTNDEIIKKEIEFDMAEQKIIISKKKFDYKQLEKKIKYRIMEIYEWKTISETIVKTPQFKNKNYNEILLDVFINDYTNKLNNNLLKEDQKMFIQKQLESLKEIKTQ